MTNDLRPNQEEMSMTTEASLEFLPREVPSDDGPTTIEAADVIPGILALRRLTCLDGEILYMLMHSPTGCLIFNVGCSDLGDAITAATDLWKLFDPGQRKRLESSIQESFAGSNDIVNLAASVWYTLADVRVNFFKPVAKAFSAKENPQ